MKRDERRAARDDHRVERTEKQGGGERRGVVDRDLHLHGEMDRPQLCDRRHRHEYREEDGVRRPEIPSERGARGEGRERRSEDREDVDA
jgi:hypothetical protein